MPYVMNLPKTGVNMTEANIVQWMFREGDTVNEGDHLLDIESDKAVEELAAPVTGILQQILQPEGAEVPCQTPIAVILQAGEGVETATPQSAATASAVPAEQPQPVTPATPVPTPVLQQSQPMADRQRISPLAKKIAAELGVPLDELRPAQPGGRIVKADVLAAAQSAAPQSAAPAPAAAGSWLPYAGIRRRIGERMAESWHTAPAVALTLHTDATVLVRWRNELKAAGCEAGYTELIAWLTARALREYPLLAARLQGDRIELPGDIHVGIAVHTERGLMVPVLHNADRLGLRELCQSFRAKAGAARAGSIVAADLEGGLFTITNLGMYEVEEFAPIINPPQCAILALGAIVREPVAVGDAVEIRPRMAMTLVFDHRIVDGAPAAQFLQRVKHLVEWPLGLLG